MDEPETIKEERKKLNGIVKLLENSARIIKKDPDLQYYSQIKFRKGSNELL